MRPPNQTHSYRFRQIPFWESQKNHQTFSIEQPCLPERFNKYLNTWNTWALEPWGPNKEPPFEHTFTIGRLHGVNGIKRRIRVNAKGFLYPEGGNKLRRAHLRIALIGGSTIELVALSAERRISGDLERILRTAGLSSEVFNLGVSAQDSRSHITVLTHHAVHLNLNVVVFLLGANDLYRIGWGFNPWIGSWFHRFAFRINKKWIVTRSQIGRLLYAVRDRIGRMFMPARSSVPLNDPYFGPALRKRATLPVIPFAPHPNSDLLAEYAKNIITMNAVANAHGIRALFLTQPSLWCGDQSVEKDGMLWMSVFSHNGRFYRLPANVACDMLSVLNNMLLEVCKSRHYWCIDLASRIPPTPDYFYDDMHFNENGAHRVAEIIATAIEGTQ